MTFFLTITEKGGKPDRKKFDQPEITIGRVAGNDIVLAKGNISKRHSRIVLRDAKFIIVDLKSTNGTYVNGRRISAPQVLKSPDKVYIGDYTIQVEGDEMDAGDELDDSAAPAPTPPPAASSSPPVAAQSARDDGDPGADDILFDDIDDKLVDEAEKLLGDDGSDEGEDLGLDEGLDDMLAAEPAPPPPPPPKAAAPAPAPRKKAEPPPPAKETPAKEPPAAREKPAERPRVAAANGSSAPALEISPEVANARRIIYDQIAGAVEGREDDRAAVEVAAQTALDGLKRRGAPAGINLDVWKRDLVEEFAGRGVLTPILADETVSAVYINGPHRIFVSRGPGEAHAEPFMFSSSDALVDIVSRMVRSAGLRFDEESPIVDARLSDGTRINAVHPACAASGPIVTVSRPSVSRATLEDLQGNGVLSAGMVEFLDTCVRTRRNVLVCGAPSASTATLTGALAQRIPATDRIVVVEPVPEIELTQPHVVHLEARAPSRMRALVANALRMHPDRLVVHELAGPEALEVVIAMGGGQEGTITSLHASSAADALARLAMMVVMGGEELSVRAVRQQIAGSLDVVVCLNRYPDGTERITEILEVTGAELDLFTTQEIFSYRREGGGKFVPKGEPRFYQELKQRGEKLDMAIFR
jgi:pilus assembly protein CpaF